MTSDITLEQAKERTLTFNFDAKPQPYHYEYSYTQIKPHSVLIEVFKYSPNYNYLQTIKAERQFQISDPKYVNIPTPSGEETLNLLAYQLQLPNELMLCHFFGPLRYAFDSDGLPMEVNIFTLEKNEQRRYFINHKEYTKEDFFKILKVTPHLYSIEKFFKSQEQYSNLNRVLDSNANLISTHKI